MKSKLFVVSGPSGSGKSTITKEVCKRLGVVLSISATSRKARVGEVDGKDYYFLSNEEFEKKIKNDEFFEYAKVHGNYYGTLVSTVEKNLAEGKSVLLEIDVQGGLIVKKKKKDAVLIFCKTENEEILEKRLRIRNTDAEDVIQLRLNNEKKEMKYIDKYDYVIVNKDLEISIENLMSIIPVSYTHLTLPTTPYV